jgi:MFS family permease
MTAPAIAADITEQSQARRNVWILAVAAAISGSLPAICITLGGLTGLYLLGEDKSLATLPVSGFQLGVALGALPAALLMRHVGRRLGFIAGALVAALGGVLSALSVVFGQFALFFVAMTAVGFSGAFAQQYRFAAADTGSEAFRARAISSVMLGGIAAAVIGPQTVIYTRDLLAPIPFAGAFLAMSGLAIAALIVVSLLGGSARAAPKAAATAGGRPLSEIVRQPRFIVAVLCAMGSYALMSLVMTAAPLAMVACGLGEDNAALGIQWHIIAMFGPSFVTGALIARFGAEAVIAVGMGLLAGCGVVGLTGTDLAHFWIALILLGVGWNFGFVGATTMLTQTYRIEERGKVQGLNDFLVFGSVAVASFSSGKLFTSVGWEILNVVVFPVVAVCLVGVAVAFAARRRADA